jgi:hypothetical protein
MNNTKYLTGTVLGAIPAAIGIWLRLAAYSLAWPKSYSYGGERENTVWAIQERAYQDLGLMLAIFGLAILVATFAKWLSSE